MAASMSSAPATATAALDLVRDFVTAQAEAEADASSWTVCCLDGTFSVALPDDPRVAGAKRDVPHHAMELFAKGTEEPLADEERLVSTKKAPLFMLLLEADGRAPRGSGSE